MRSRAVRTLALALLLCGASMSQAQTPPSGGRKPPESSKSQGANSPHSGEKSKLEEMLAEALKNNPDIRVADANVTLAEAELNRTRLQVTQKVVTLYHAIQSQQATVNHEQKHYDRMQGLLADRAINSTLVEERFAKLTAAKAKLEELEAQIPALLGKSPQADADAARALTRQLDKLIGQQELLKLQDLQVHLTWERSAKEAGPMAERLRKALQTPVKVDYKDMTFDAILNDLAKKAPGLEFRNLSNFRNNNATLSLRFEEALPVSAILQALADETRCLFYVREYGILATHYASPGVMTVEDFLRHKPADESRPQSRGGKNPPLQNVSGHVKAVDASGLITIDIGTNAGLVKGYTLELSRMPNNPVLDTTHHLGTIRILEAKAKEAVGQAIGYLRDKPKVGDFVTNAPILGN